MKIRLLRPWTQYDTGESLNVDLDTGRKLIGAGLAVYVGEEEKTKAVEGSPKDKMIRSSPTRKRGRPKGSKNKNKDSANTG